MLSTLACFLKGNSTQNISMNRFLILLGIIFLVRCSTPNSNDNQDELTGLWIAERNDFLIDSIRIIQLSTSTYSLKITSQFMKKSILGYEHQEPIGSKTVYFDGTYNYEYDRIDFSDGRYLVFDPETGHVNVSGSVFVKINE